MREIDDWKVRLSRPASLMVLGGFRPPEEPIASWFGRVTLQHPDESWPVGQAGRLLWPLCQFVLSEGPFVPESIRNLALIQIFVDPEDCVDPETLGWQIRAYEDLNSLIPLAIEPPRHQLKPLPVRWELIEHDFPHWEELPYPDFPTELADTWLKQVNPTVGTKLGGWPVPIQHGVAFDARNGDEEYVFQIESEPRANWNLVDSGVAYFACSPGGHDWVRSVQFY